MFLMFVIGFYASAMALDGSSVPFDGPTGKEEKVWNNQRFLVREVPFPALSILRESKGLSGVESQTVLLSIAVGSWITASAEPVVSRWMIRRVKLVGGAALLAEVVDGGFEFAWIPVKSIGDKYEYGPWTYSHCGPSAEFDSCLWTVRVQFEVISDSVIQGTVYAQHLSERKEFPFVYYKK